MDTQQYVDWFRASSPYIHAHRGKTFVIAFGGESIKDGGLVDLLHDVALLSSLGVRLVLVHGARPQIEDRLARINEPGKFSNGLRITTDAALACAQEASGSLRVQIESQLSRGVANSPSSDRRIRVSSGNFVIAKPLGVVEGLDFCHTGEVRRIDSEAIEAQLELGSIVLLSPIGYSGTGESFNLSAEDVAAKTAIALNADKLIYLQEQTGLLDNQGDLICQITPKQAQQALETQTAEPELSGYLKSAIAACRNGVNRAHLIGAKIDGVLLLELFTRDGTGTMITDETYEGIRSAEIEDVGGILELIEPLEAKGVLVRRSREYLEIEIDHFLICERDGMIVGCMGLYPYPDAKIAELACVAIHPDYRNSGRGDALLDQLERNARKLNIQTLFVLTTQTAHWFQERGFKSIELDQLPVKKQQLYNYHRNSKVFAKPLGNR